MTQPRKPEEFKLIESRIETLPPHVKLEDLQENGQLFTDAQNAAALKLPPGKHKKGGVGMENFPFSVLVTTPDLVNPAAQLKDKKTYIAYKKIGGGGYGKVRLGLELNEDPTRPKRWVAIKFQTQEFESREAFERKSPDEVLRDARLEADILARLNQGGGQIQREKKPKEKKSTDKEKKSESTPYLHQHIVVMEYVSGVELTQLPRIKMSTADRLNICKNALLAVAAWHNEKLLLHRDIKPQNIMINRRTGEVKLVDVALAKRGVINRETGALESEDIPVGSPLYMAPEILEQISKAKPEDMHGIVYSEKTEVYSLGMALAQALQLVALTDTPPEKLAKIENEALRPYLHKKLTFIDKESDNYKNHPFLREATTRNEIYHLLKSLADPNPEARPSIKDAVGIISRLQEQYLQAPTQMRKTAVVSLDDLQEMDEDDRFDQLTKLRKQSEIVFVSNSPRKPNDIEVLSLFAELESKGVMVHPTIFTPDSKEVSLDAVADKIKPILDRDPNIVREYEVVHIKEKPKLKAESDFELALTTDRNRERVEQINRVLTLLQKDIKRLEDKYKGKNKIVRDRIEVIQKGLYKISHNPDIDFDGLVEQIEAIQKSMFNSSFIKGRLFSKTKSSHSSKDFEEVRVDIKNRFGS